MVSWLQFSIDAPDLAAFGRRRLESRIAYLATIRLDGSPRLHPVSPFIAGGKLYVYMEPASPKGHDLRRDARYAMHGGVEDNSGGEGEFLLFGRALEISDSRARQEAFAQARQIGYDPQERYILFELRIAEARATVYEVGKAKSKRWKAA